MKITPYVLKRRFLQTLIFIRYLIKNKGNVTLLILKEDFDNIYNVQEDNESYIIHTTMFNIMYDIINDKSN